MPPNANLFHRNTGIPLRNPSLLTNDEAHSFNDDMNIPHQQIAEFDGYNPNTRNADDNQKPRI